MGAHRERRLCEDLMDYSERLMRGAIRDIAGWHLRCRELDRWLYR